ncbi:MAG: hypothetical protein ACL7AX_04260 [Candidatus Arsenophonus phytopathogenicus]
MHKLGITPEFAHGDWLHLLAGALLGALLPDIDHPSSSLGPLFRFCANVSFMWSPWFTRMAAHYVIINSIAQ